MFPTSICGTAAGALFAWKVGLLVLVILLALWVYRPFCKYICPLGAVYSLFNPVALYRYEIWEDKCTKCGRCAFCLQDGYQDLAAAQQQGVYPVRGLCGRLPGRSHPSPAFWPGAAE